MASPFRDDVVAMLVGVFADLGFDATYTPAGGGAAVELTAIPDAEDVESLGVDYGMRARQTRRLVALLKSDVADRPQAGATIAIPTFGDFTVTEEAMCLDKFQLVWLCAVTE